VKVDDKALTLSSNDGKPVNFQFSSYFDKGIEQKLALLQQSTRTKTVSQRRRIQEVPLNCSNGKNIKKMIVNNI